MFTTSKIATTTLLALALGMGLSACSPAHNDDVPNASPTASTAAASATASPSANEDVSTETTTSVASATASETAGSVESADPGKTKESANDAMNSFMASIKAEAGVLASDPAALAATKEPGGFEKAFANSISYMDKSKFSDDLVTQIVGGFATIYLTYPDATIVSKDASAVAISGDTAAIDGNAFTITVNGTEHKGSAGKGGSIVLTFADGQWKITGYDAGASSK